MLSVRRRLLGLLVLLIWLSMACAGLSARGYVGPTPGSRATGTSLPKASSPLPATPSRDEHAPSAAKREFRFERISIEQGLSQSSVYSIYQDSTGFIWAGTQDGLNKFDGYRFTQFKPMPGYPNSLSHNYVLAIYEDHEGTLWVGTNGGGLQSLRPGAR